MVLTRASLERFFSAEHDYKGDTPVNVKTLIIIPTYNEIDNIEPLTRAIFAVVPQVNILIVDDGSPDGTGDLVEQLGEKDKRFHLIRRAGKLGLGSAYLAGFKYALEHGFELVFEMDGDFSHQPKYLPDFIRAAENADLVIGSRYIAGGGVENWSLVRRLVSLGGSLYSRLILGVPYRDLTGGFKCFRRAVLQTLDLGAVRSEGYSFQIEMTYRVHRRGFKIVETPIIFADRQEGVSKMSWGIFIEAIFRVWQIRFTV